MMSAIRGTNTAPEIAVRRFLHSRGLRYRLHVRGLPGTPDLVLPKFKAAIFIHGCFWHQHAGCRYAYQPKSNRAFWRNKLDGNVRRDKATLGRLRRMGWRVTVFWECDVKNERKLDRLLTWIRKSEPNLGYP
jgi:DNA mismatch endonuclease, patch repair protein